MWWRFLLLLCLGLLLLAGGMGYYGYREFERDLPERWSALTDYHPARASRVFSREGELIGEFYLQKRIVLDRSQIPPHVAQAFVAAEDSRFYRHRGIDPLGILRAAVANLRAGRVVQGGSTITQQVAKLMLLSGERSLERKIREAILARKIEQRLSKDQILTLYLNHVYLGHGAYGVQAAAEVYFGKDAQQLTLAEAAMLAGLPKAPTEDSPYSNYGRARERQAYVLARMEEEGFITASQRQAAWSEPIAIISRDLPLNHVAAPYFVEMVRREVQRKYGRSELFDRGLRIYTTLSMPAQRAAELAVRRGLEDLQRRLGFSGPVATLEGEELRAFLQGPPRLYRAPGELQDDGETTVPPASVSALAGTGRAYLAAIEKLGSRTPIARIGRERVPLHEPDAARIERWAARKGNTLRPGALVPVRVELVQVGEGRRARQVEMAVLAERPSVQGALVALEPATGKLVALVGGYDYKQSQFNRAVQARRQAGSSIKPFIYAAALERGYTELSIVPDAPISIRTASGVWSPHNYKAEYLGPITLRTALAKSINTVSVRLVASLGVDTVIDSIRRFGITTPIVRHISVALGTPEVSLMAQSYAYAVLANGGLRIEPTYIESIVDADGNIIEDHRTPPPPVRRLDPAIAYIMVDLMQNVVQNGTGRKALALGRPVAGKTGTSNDFRDAWFIGFTPDLLCGVWVGRDDFKSIGPDATGGQTALPLWLDFMQRAHPPGPVRDFPIPPGIYFVRALPDKGTLVPPGTPGSVLIPFKRGTLPAQVTSLRSDFADDSF
ncbi:MAG: PBP1A family penicillin-binding protein [Myxococcales bacterium]|nr:PBP1A family penicillin-binding protein [Myxococcota bacterium]MDW8283533.1 PBP1A family penicillin-binding protein [Myxococcales bacterium]